MNNQIIDWHGATPFSHIYVEEQVRTYPRTKQILAQFPRATVVPIHHYKDVFCRKKQSVRLQQDTPMLILAAKEGELVYEGAPVCQSFGNEFFYYTSCAMNCLYACDYCYLKGMYGSGNFVIFVNLEDIFAEVTRLLQKHPVYLSISYDTDLLAWEEVTGFIATWMDFVNRHENLKIEVRTKCGRQTMWDTLPACDRTVFAFTISPETVIRTCEHRTATLEERLASVVHAMDRGYPVRLCYDPMIYFPDWRSQYTEMLDKVEQTIDLKKVHDVSVGSFRISQQYLKKLRHVMPDAAVVQYPFENHGGVYQYPPALQEEMELFLVERLGKSMSLEKIFRWDTHHS